jgi:hypothetical protein
MLGTYRVAAQLVAYLVVLSSTELVSHSEDGTMLFLKDFGKVLRDYMK